MITVTITGTDAQSALTRAASAIGYARGAELRIDWWKRIDPQMVADCLTNLQQHFTEVVLTMRLEQDGGLFSGSRAERNAVLQSCVELIPDGVWLDMELEQLSDADDQRICNLLPENSRVIRSYHSFTDGIDIAALQQLGVVSEKELPKAAVRPNSTEELIQLLQFARSFRPGDQIVLGMGEWGIPSRMCPMVFGSLWSYASDADSPAAPGQMTATEMVRRGRTNMHDKNTRFFAIFGNPVMHSSSPDYHNARFREAKVNAAYIPFPLSSAGVGLDVMQHWPLSGVSITIPHKNGVLQWPDGEPDDAALAVGAANTAVSEQRGLQLYNTDVEGFLHPLIKRGFNLRSTRCLVIGAGGAARAVVYGLLTHGARVLVVNRTMQRAQKLRDDMLRVLSHADVQAAALPAENAAELCHSLWGDDAQLIVQTTQVGMEPNIEGDPLQGYQFSGRELVYDIIYTPEHTTLLHRAAAAGCPVITGRAMFIAQAEAQSRHFFGVLTDASK